MKLFLLALQFLTILPVKIKGEVKESDFGHCLAYFPVVGLLIGAFFVLVLPLLAFLPISVTSVLILIISIVVTAGIHLDGFADTCDGLYGVKPKEEILQIMRDPRIGVMGVVGITLLLLLKFSLIISISRDMLWQSLLLECCFSRWAQATACLMPYARNEGKAGAFIKYARKKDILIAGLFTISVSCTLFGLKGIVIFFTSLLTVLLFMRYVKTRIGGMTGDTIGAVNEIAQVSVLFSILTLSSIWT